MASSTGSSPSRALLDVASSLQCPICLETLTDAVETDCGHAFCEECLLQSVRQAPHCPTCRLRITGVIPSYTIRYIVATHRAKKGSASGSPWECHEEQVTSPASPTEPCPNPLNPAYRPLSSLGPEAVFSPHPPMAAINTSRAAHTIKTVRVNFLPRHPLFCTAGGFDPGSAYLSERLSDFLTPAEFDGFIEAANRLARRWTPGLLDCWVLGCLLWPLGGCCFLCWWADSAKDKLRELITESNRHTQPKGYMWTLNCDESTTCELDEHFYLEMTVDSRWRVDMYNTPKTRQIHQLVQERTMMETVLRHRGIRIFRSVSGHVSSLSPVHGNPRRTSGRSEASSTLSPDVGSPMSAPPLSTVERGPPGQPRSASAPELAADQRA